MQSHNVAIRPFAAAVSAPAEDTSPALSPDPVRQSLSAKSQVQTASGVQPLDTIKIGQRLRTRSGALVPVTHIEHVHFTERQLQDNPDLAPIRFDPGALPGTSDADATLLSPDCLVAWTSGPRGMSQFPARAFCDGGLIRRVIPDGGIDYIRLYLETPQEICAGNLWIEINANNCICTEMPVQGPRLVHDIRIFRPIRD